MSRDDSIGWAFDLAGQGPPPQATSDLYAIDDLAADLDRIARQFRRLATVERSDYLTGRADSYEIAAARIRNELAR